MTRRGTRFRSRHSKTTPRATLRHRRASMARQWKRLLATEGVPTGDGRLLDPKAVEWGEGPWPLRFSPQGDHASAFVIGAATEVWRSGSDIWGRGSLHDDSRDDNVRTAVNRVIELASFGLAGLSVGLDDESVELRLKADLVKIYDSWEQA